MSHAPCFKLQVQKLCAMQVHDELREYDDLISSIQATPDQDLETIIADIRPKLTQPFFEHLDSVIHATVNAPQYAGMINLVLLFVY